MIDKLVFFVISFSGKLNYLRLQGGVKVPTGGERLQAQAVVRERDDIGWYAFRWFEALNR